MSKKPTTITIRDIAETITEARKQPPAVTAWSTFKAIKPQAYAAKVAEMKKKNEEARKAGESELQDEELKELQPGIEDARVRRHLDKFGLNASITAFVKDIKSKYEVKPQQYSEDDAARLKMILEKRVRIGNAVPGYLRSFCEEIVNDLVHIAVEAALRADRKIVLMQHIFDSNGFYINSALFKNLFVNLPAFVAAREHHMERDRNLLIAKVVRTYLTEFSRNINANSHEKHELVCKNVEAYLAPDKKKKEDLPQPAAAEASASAEARPKKDARFSFYIKKMYGSIRDTDPRYVGLRFGHDLTPFIDTILNEFIQLVANRAIIHIATTDAQTVSTAVIRSIIIGMMANPSDLLERTVTLTKVDGKYEPHMDTPRFIKFIDELYPLPPKVPHPRVLKDKAPAAADKPKAPVAETSAKPKTPVKAKPAAPAVPAAPVAPTAPVAAPAVAAAPKGRRGKN